ncbi:HAD family hydrolase [Paenibacillus hamazuiensis]|uniref:HAD family hydrolase n=1 Tax=Paenibacillus hamazuiensis TaxID=2936508 RepID=UPI00200ED349|nr:HAD family hydrolase [Paenibacillus hamazuiensis]
MNKQYIIFNLDDTLAHCNKYFDEVIERFADTMMEWFSDRGVSREQIKRKQLDIDLASVHEHGITSAHFPQSFVDTYEFFCKETATASEPEKAELVRQLGKSVYDYEVEPFPYMYETLDTLKDEGHELFLHTGGDPLIQRKKISQLQLAAYFENRVFVSTFKDAKALDKILGSYPFERSRTWMIGNSIRTDIIPGLENGINVIYIPAQSEWQYNIMEIDIEPKGAYLTLQSLNEVPEAIRKYSISNANSS